MSIERDKRIKEGESEISKKLGKLYEEKKGYEDKKLKTNCRLSYPDSKEVYNIRSMFDDIFEFHRAKLKMIKDYLPENIKIAGFTVPEWLEDMDVISNRKRINAEITRLENLQSQLVDLYSADAKADNAVDEIFKAL